MASDDNVMIVKIPRTTDEALDSVAPEFMQGTNKASVRVNWALHEFLRERRDEEAKREKEGQQ